MPSHVATVDFPTIKHRVAVLLPRSWPKERQDLAIGKAFLCLPPDTRMDVGLGWTDAPCIDCGDTMAHADVCAITRAIERS